MQGSIEEMAYTVGGAIVSPNLGVAELMLALVVACGFAVCAFGAAFGHGRNDEAGWH
jgi:hypothetical protein